MVREENENVIHAHEAEMERQWGNQDFQSGGGQDISVDKSNNKLINQMKKLYAYLRLLT